MSHADTKDITIRRLETMEEYQACVALQKATWGENFADLVPLSMLKVCQRVGGVTAGAFDERGELVGFVFGVSGIRDNRRVHWSDMLAVKPELRGAGIGRRLKLYQRQLLLEIGVDSVYWTFDPLEARNAHFNFNKLAVEVDEYVENMYGDTGSVLHAGLGTDRFIVAWLLAAERVFLAIQGGFKPNPEPYENAPIVTCAVTADRALPDTPRVRVEIPERIQEIKARSPEEGATWRQSTRRAFSYYLSRGYHVESFFRDPGHRYFYGLTRD